MPSDDVRQEAERHLRRLLPDDPLHTIVSALLAQLAAQEQEIARLTRIGEMCGADADRWRSSIAMRNPSAMPRSQKWRG